MPPGKTPNLLPISTSTIIISIIIINYLQLPPTHQVSRNNFPTRTSSEPEWMARWRTVSWCGPWLAPSAQSETTRWIVTRKNDQLLSSFMPKTHIAHRFLSKGRGAWPSPIAPQHHCGRLLVHWPPTRALPNKIFQTQLPRNVNDNSMSWRLNTTCKITHELLELLFFSMMSNFQTYRPSPSLTTSGLPPQHGTC